jgi:glucoamylase
VSENKNLRIEVLAPAVLRWSIDGWSTTHDSKTRDTKLGVHIIDFEREQLPGGGKLLFTFYWSDAQRWEGVDFQISL